MRHFFEKSVLNGAGQTEWIPDWDKAWTEFDRAVVGNDDVVKWDMGNLVPMGIVRMWNDLDLVTHRNFVETQRAHDVQLMKIRADMKGYKHSEEDIAEMRNVFGEGSTVVNILTGKETIL